MFTFRAFEKVVFLATLRNMERCTSDCRFYHLSGNAQTVKGEFFVLIANLNFSQ